MAAFWLIILLYGITDGFADEESSFQIKPTGDGFLRLDSKTGRTDYCQRRGITWACRMIVKPTRSETAAPASDSMVVRGSRFAKTMFVRFISAVNLIKNQFAHSRAVK